MNVMETTFDCVSCENKDYCPEKIRGRTMEVVRAISDSNLPIEFIKRDTPPNIKYFKKCALLEKRVRLDQILPNLLSLNNDASIITWFSCDTCNKKSVCAKKETISNWMGRFKSEINESLISPSICAPWTDTDVVCELCR